MGVLMTWTVLFWFCSRLTDRRTPSSLEDARQKLEKFRERYNHRRPHSAFGGSDAGSVRGAAELHRLGKEKASTSMGAHSGAS